MKTKAIRKLMVIDDDEGIFNRISSALNYYFGNSIAAISSPSVADGFSRYFTEAPDLVFLDIHFSADNESVEGIELLKRIKQIPTPRFVPFVILSDRLSINKELTGLNEQLMPDDFLAKPITDAEVFAKIMQWDRTLYAERKLAAQTKQLTKKADDLAGRHIATMKYLDEQHSVASLGLITMGLLSLFSDTLVSVRGYASIMETVLIKKPINISKIDKISAAILNSTDPARKVIAALQSHFEISYDQEIEEDITPILDGILLLARHELLSKQLEILRNFSPVEKCIVIPGFLMQAVISILLFYRDASIPGSVLEVTCRQNGPSVWVEFSCPVLREYRDKAAEMVTAQKQKLSDGSDSISAECFSLKAAADLSKRMDGDLDIKVSGENIRVVLFLKVRVQERGLFEA